ncbi:MAG: DUF4173 domain-containing protein [Bacteroidales bacterium]|nr:DUF4173 domain-containing protein [Bacteroidales bacterium]
MKTKSNLLAVFASTAVMTLLFYRQEMGINLFLFELLLLLWLYLSKQLPLETTLQKLLIIGLIVTSAATVLVHSILSYVVHYLLFIVLIGLWSSPLFRMLPLAGLQAFLQFFVAQWLFFKRMVSKKLNGKALSYYLRKAGIFIVPLIMVLIFFSMYRTASPLFDSWFGRTGEWISKAFDYLMQYFDSPILVTIFWSLIFSNFILLHHSNPHLARFEKQLTEDIQRQRKKKLIGFKSTSLKTEHKAALVMLVALNMLILIMNISDVYWVWFKFEWDGQYLKQFVHEGTYLLIFSIMVSIGIVLFYFRGNLNFYKKNGLLKKLSYIWLAQNALLAVSVGIRNYWYIYYYALAYKRIGVILFLLLTLYGLYSVFVKVRKQKTVFYLLRVNFNTLLILLTLSTLVNWDSYISRFNFAHADRSFVHYDFLSDMSYASLPYLDKSLKELHEIEQSQKERFPTVEQYMQSQEFYDHIQERKSDFISIWKRKSLLEWNLPEYRAYRQLIKK